MVRAWIALAFIAVAGADDAHCSGTDGLDDPPAVSMLQTEMRVDRPSSKVKKGTRHMTKEHTKKHKATASDIGIWGAVALALLASAGFASSTLKRGEPSSLAKYVAEFIGTFMLIFSVGCNVLVGDKTWGVTSIACTLMVSIYALGGISGANFNPAVSIALGLAKKLPWVDVSIYICVQLAAGILAGLSYAVILGDTFNLKPAEGFSLFEAGLAELLYTFMLTFVVLNTAASKQHGGKDQFYGLAIGFTVVAGGYGAGSISGGCFNPAVALGIDSSSMAMGFGNCFVYWIFEIVGCAIAALCFRECRPGDFEESASTTFAGKLLSEFLGTYMLVLTVGLNVLNESKAGVFSIASALMCMIFALGSVSGAHFNPAVTMAIACAGRDIISMSEACLYICVQVLGGISAAFTYALMMHGKTVPLAPKIGAGEALAGEFLFTFLLSYVVLCVATVKDSPLTQYFGLAIGATVIAGGYAIGSLSGGSLNPAVSAGLAVSDFSMNGGPLEHFFTYSAVELMGGMVAAGIFHVTHEHEYSKANFKGGEGGIEGEVAKALAS